jgi:hypothetical protein
MALKVCDGRFNHLEKSLYLTNKFWSLIRMYDQHQKIMSYNVIKKITQSITLDLNTKGKWQEMANCWNYLVKTWQAISRNCGLQANYQAY